MVIEQAQASDLENLMEVFNTCGQTMRAQGLDQWDGTYPVSADVAEDISRKEVFVIREEAGRVGATITLNAQQDEQYATIAWQYHADRILVIHRLAVLPRHQGKGYATSLCLFAEQYAREQNYAAIRLDCYTKNEVSNHLYQKLNYHRPEGWCYFHGNPTPFCCYEKVITI